METLDMKNEIAVGAASSRDSARFICAISESFAAGSRSYGGIGIVK